MADGGSSKTFAASVGHEQVRAILVIHNSNHSYSIPFGNARPLNPAVRLKVQSWGAVALVSGLLIFHQLLLQPTLMQLNADAPVINVSGRQRMLSQKLAKTALALQTAKDSQSRLARRGELEVVVDQWTRAHRGLQKGDSDLHLRGKNSPEVRTAFAKLEPHFQAILHAVQSLLQDDDIEHTMSQTQLDAIDQILEHEDEFLSQMHALVGLYTADARNHVWQLQILGWGIVAAILAVLLTIHWLVIRPAVDLIGSRFASSEDQYRRLVETMSEGLIVQDLNGLIQFANPRFCQIIGLSAEELQGKLASLFIADADRSRFHRMVEASVSQAEPAELALRRRDGQFTETMASTRPLTDERGATQGFLLVVTDITARKQAEQRSRDLLEQLVHADRLKSMGELAAGLAHEINQPLAAIANYSEACLASLLETIPSATSLQVPLQRILAAAMRGGEIIRRSRRFAQRRPHEIQLENLSDLVRDVEQLCRPEALRRDVKVELALASDLPSLPVDGIQIQQVLTNLIQNAFTAMEATPTYRRRLRITTASLNDIMIVVSVSDSGPGVNELESQQIFEPFVTTRADGLGLGLAIARNIVESHGGTIEVTRNPDAGATFQFTLPIQPPTVVAPLWANLNEEPLHA
ncbi:MAG: domain S-box protein [Planctomycetaceae bacterium]|nr:domain S-box protein [Planctomycetaceae bacterium]